MLMIPFVICGFVLIFAGIANFKHCTSRMIIYPSLREELGEERRKEFQTQVAPVYIVAGAIMSIGSILTRDMDFIITYVISISALIILCISLMPINKRYLGRCAVLKIGKKKKR